MNVVEVRGIRKSYERKGNGRADVLRMNELDVPEGDFLSIVGPSGCGKTTLLNIVGLLDRPDAGTLKIDGEDMTKASESVRGRVRNRKIGFVFQQFNLFPDLTAVKNVALPLIPAGVPRGERTTRAQELLERVGLRHRADHLPTQMSGGEQQRVAIARALVSRPRLLLADEPTGNLDKASTGVIMDLFQGLHKDLGTTILLVTHDQDVAKIAKRTLRAVLPK
jgi:putative ABC transport system ATP-binding protein